MLMPPLTKIYFILIGKLEDALLRKSKMVKNVQIMVPNCLMHSLNNSSQKLERNTMYETCGITSNSIFLFLIGKL